MAKIISTIVLLVACNLLLSIHAEKLVPCYFVFGDSLVDNGNNNNRATTAKANYLPYGVDFPGGPTGRWTNGRNKADFIAEALGFTDHIPPFASISGDALLGGVNYASGSAGILRTTGKQFGDVISLDEQLQYHQSTVDKIASTLGSSDAAMKHLGQCIYTVGMGSNDYAAYALLLAKPMPEQYASMLINEYSRQLRDLYAKGARKVALFGLGDSACVPSSLNGAPYGPVCLSESKFTTGVFDDKLKSLVDELNKELSGAHFTYIDQYSIVVSDPSFNGLRFKNLPCCMASGTIVCLPNAIICNDRQDYAYFDGVHPTEAAAGIVAKRAFAAQSPSDAYPFDIQHLASM